jgi:hypothetical protein
MNFHLTQDMQVKIADGAAAASGIIWVSAKAAEWGPILQDLSFLVAIVAGIVAIGYHLHNWDHKK